MASFWSWSWSESRSQASPRHRRRWAVLWAALALMIVLLPLDAGLARGQDAGTGDATPPSGSNEGADAASSAEMASFDLPTAETPRLAHIHAGTCDELGIVVYALSDLRSYRLDPSDEASDGTTEMIVGTADVPLADIFAEPFSIHVHQDAQNKQIYLGCADVGGRPPEPWTEADGLALELVEQADSGYSGFVSLEPAANGGTFLSLFLANPPAADGQEPTPAATPPPGSTYSSPTFGYTLFYGPIWEISQETSRNGRDSFVLTNGTSFVTFTGAEGFQGDPQSCVEDFAATLTADPNVSNLELATDEDGQPMSGGTEATGAFAVFDHDYTFPDRVEAYTLFIGCIPLIPGEAVLAVVQNAPADAYNDEIPLREALLRGFTLPQ